MKSMRPGLLPSSKTFGRLLPSGSDELRASCCARWSQLLFHTRLEDSSGMNWFDELNT